MLEVHVRMSNGNGNIFNCDDDYFVDFVKKWMHEIIYIYAKWVNKDGCIYQVFQKEESS